MAAQKTHLTKVLLASDVYAACLQHAFASEKEEIMGLLIGEVNEERCISYISAYMILQRSDKQPDRVEISPEQLSTGAQYAEELADKLKKPMRVLGWYHSHPHITVWPSHVDLMTQMMYQMMDPLFVGLIFSVYQNDISSVLNRIQVTCFQAHRLESEYRRREVELVIENTNFQRHNLKNMKMLPQILSQEAAHSCEEQDGNNTEDELAVLHNEALKTVALVNTVSKISKPLYEDFEARLQSVYVRIAELEEIKKELLEENFVRE